MAFMNINLLGQAFSDFLLTDVGAAEYELEHDWFTKEDLVITIGPGGEGIPLSEGVDYQLSEEDTELSERVTAAVGSTRIVYHKVQIINATYQTGDLYHSGKYIADSNDAEDQVPPGGILPYGGVAAPAGWLLCDGSAISRLTYRRLFDAISTAFGVGDGSTTFDIPDLQGMFLRGAGTYGGATKKANGNDYEGPAVGALQEDGMQGHWHRAMVGTVGGTTSWLGSNNYTGSSINQIREALTDGVNGTPRTGDETRLVSIGVNYIIKT